MRNFLEWLLSLNFGLLTLKDCSIFLVFGIESSDKYISQPSHYERTKLNLCVTTWLRLRIQSNPSQV